jgi:hypothetical protein
MLQNHTAFPNITRLIKNTIIDEQYSWPMGYEESVLKSLDECLGAEGVYFADFKRLDTWIATLSKEISESLTTDGLIPTDLALAENIPEMEEAEESAIDWLNTTVKYCFDKALLVRSVD